MAVQDIDLTKQILSGNEIREKLIIGANKVADAVGSTLGPMGKNVIIEVNKFGDAKITKDGVSVAKEVFLEDKWENLGAQLLKKVALKSVKDAGDGTTSSTVLAQAILNNSKDYQFKNVHAFKKGMEIACKEIVEKIKTDYSKPIATVDDVYNVAMISSNQDEQISSVIKQCYQQLGIKDIVIKLDSQSCLPQSKVEISQGFQYDKPLPSPHLVNNYEKMRCELNDCFVLLIDRDVPSFNYLVPYLKKIIETSNLPVVILAHSFSDEALQSIVANKTQKQLDIYCVEAPGYGVYRRMFMEDLSVLTGGTKICAELGNENSFDVSYLGRLSSFTSNQFTTTLQFGYGDPDKIEKHINAIKSSIENGYELDVANAQERISKLTSGMAVIHVGGSTELEIKETYDRFEDAIGAVKAAVEEGISPGAGYAYYHAYKPTDVLKGFDESVILNLKKKLSQYDFDVAQGKSLVYQSSLAVMNKLIKNAEIENSDAVITEQGTYDFVKMEPVADWKQSTIIDPTKVLRCSLENAVSVCSLILTTDVGMVYKKALDVNSTVHC